MLRFSYFESSMAHIPAITGFIAALICGCQVEQPPHRSEQAAKTSHSDTKVAKSGGKVSADPRKSGMLDVVPVFKNVSATLGLDFTFYPDRVPGRFFLPEVMGGGIAVLDLDLDGWRDLYLMNGAVIDTQGSSPGVHGNGVFRNLRSREFRDVSQVSSGDDGGYGQGAIAGDFNTDGFTDLYLTNYGPNVLLMNNGDGTFADVTAMAGVGDPSWGTSGVAVDLNSDGLLDIYVANYMNVTLQNNQACRYGESLGYCGPGNYDGVNDLAYVNNGDGSFTENAGEMGFLPFSGKGLAVAISDFNLDFQPDIYVGNDMDPNFLFIRNSKSEEFVRYQDVAPAAGCAVSADGINEASMGIACADYDRDGHVDIYLTHYYQMKNTLYRNFGQMLFEDDSFRSGVAATSFQFLGFGVIPIDFNRDSAADLFIANGHVLGGSIEPNAMTPQLLLNDGKGSFSDVSGSAGPYFEDVWLGRGVAGCDFDEDGDLDICISHIDRPVAVLRNDTRAGNHFVGVELQTANRIPAHCARVTIGEREGKDESTTQIVGGGGSYLSSSDERLLFAVVSAEAAEVTIEWPSGVTEKVSVAVDNYHRFIEGRGLVRIPH